MKVLLPFSNDSTLMFVSRLQPMLRAHGFDAISMLISEHAGALSTRQLTMLLPDGPDIEASSSTMLNFERSSFDAILIAMPPMELLDRLSDRSYRSRRDRPAYIAFNAGLEFFPARGRKNRLNFDIVFLNSAVQARMFRSDVRRNGWQYVSFGHPYFINPKTIDLSDRTDVVFFAQSISPATLDSRRFVLDLMVTLAQRHPGRKIYFKLRHLPGENDAHKHKELFSYPSMLDRYIDEKPANFEFTTANMTEILSSAAICITCTSTAAMDAISAGIPTLVYVDYPENYSDRFAKPMRKEFAKSGLIASIADIMDLRGRRPRESWIEPRFRSEDLFDEIRRAIECFQTGEPCTWP